MEIARAEESVRVLDTKGNFIFPFFNHVPSNTHYKNLYDYAVNNMNALLPAVQPKKFIGSPFLEWSHLQSTRRGGVGERILTYWLSMEGYHICKGSGGVDYEINGHPTEVKTAMEAETGGFQINQVRPKQNFEYLVLLVVRPHNLDVFTMRKNEIVPLCKGQHGGSSSVETLTKTFGSYDSLWKHLSKYHSEETLKQRML